MAGLNLKELARRTAKVGFAATDPFFPANSGPRLLIYHQVGSNLGRQMEVTERAFAYQLAWLIDHFPIVDLETALARRGQSNEPSVVLTFDDGYADFYRAGFSRLVELGLPFVLYLSTQPIESRVPFGHPGATPVNWAQVEEMVASGLMTVGAHTHTHPDLRSIGRDLIVRELDQSDQLIQDRLGVRPLHFAYPYGYWSPEADELVRERYTTAVLGGGSPITNKTDSLLLHRIPIQLSDGPFFFRRKVKTGLRMEEHFRRLVTGYRGP